MTAYTRCEFFSAEGTRVLGGRVQPARARHLLALSDVRIPYSFLYGVRNPHSSSAAG